jgi:hypothetical protein
MYLPRDKKYLAPIHQIVGADGIDNNIVKRENAYKHKKCINCIIADLEYFIACAGIDFVSHYNPPS